MMLLHLLILGLFARLEVLALNSVTVFELLNFYTAYRAEWLAGLSQADRTIARACVRSPLFIAESDFDEEAKAAGVTGMCSFDDFVKHIGTAKSFANYRSTLEGNIWDVDSNWNKLLIKLRGQNIGPYEYDLSKLLPKGGFFNMKKQPFAPAIKGIANALQNARARAVGGAGAVAVELLAQLAIEYTRIIIGGRTSDAVANNLSVAKRLIKTFPMVLQFKDAVDIPGPAPYTTSNVFHYSTEIDFDKTYSGVSGRIKNDFARAYTKELTENADTVEEHEVVIQANHEARDLHVKNVAGCTLPTAFSKREIFTLRERESSAESRFINTIYQGHLIPLNINLEAANGVTLDESFGYLGSAH